jgi:hypothetical protein
MFEHVCRNDDLKLLQRWPLTDLLDLQVKRCPGTEVAQIPRNVMDQGGFSSAVCGGQALRFPGFGH